uniref:Uncharacterized protein n=1 Tax=Anopheles minimus TaxID=112268 RepID=A0A182WQ90_9DIPT
METTFLQLGAHFQSMKGNGKRTAQLSTGQKHKTSTSNRPITTLNVYRSWVKAATERLPCAGGILPDDGSVLVTITTHPVHSGPSDDDASRGLCRSVRGIDSNRTVRFHGDRFE